MKRDTLLVIDDDALVHSMISNEFRDFTKQILHATRPEEGLTLAVEAQPDVILLDVVLPGMSGLNVCQLLKEREVTADIPVVFIAGDDNPKQIARALEVGGTDYIRKPLEAVELRARVGAALRTKHLIDLLKNYARIDPLTGLRNRVSLDEMLEALSSAHERKRTSFSLMMFEIEGMQRMSETLGRAIVDQVLVRVGETIHASSRPYDFTCRYGPEVFVLVLSQTEGEEAVRVGERFLAAIRKTEISVDGEVVSLKVNAGMASTSAHRERVIGIDLLGVAEEAMACARKSGNDRLVVAGRDFVSSNSGHLE